MCSIAITSLKMLLKTATFSIVFLSFCTAFAFQDKKPNIIYILADDLGYGDVSAFNPEGKINTVNLDQLAADGMKFTDAHTASALCTPTRYSIITGRYNWRSPLKSGVLTGISKPLIPTSRETVASMLKDAGYETGFIGKWHLGWDWQLKDESKPLGGGWNTEDFNNVDFSKKIKNSPMDLGFEYMYAIPASLDMAPYVYVENGLAEEMPTKYSEGIDKYIYFRKGQTSPHFVHQDVTPHFFEKSFNFIEEKAKSQDPFFLYLALPSPHTPIMPTPPFQGKSGLNPYGDFVLEIDHYIGQLVEKLKALDLEENTMIVFTSDNGCAPMANYEVLTSKGHNPSAWFRGTKADIFEGGHREPFIVKWPSKVAAGSTCDQTICTTDFMATCADILGLDLADDTAEDSFSMLPLLEDPGTKKYKREYTVNHSLNGSFALRQGKWKMIFCPGSGGWSEPRPNAKNIKELPKFQLYDLEEDPEEKNNLYEQEPKIAAKLKKLMASCIEDGRSTPGAKQQNENPMDGKPWQQITNIIE